MQKLAHVIHADNLLHLVLCCLRVYAYCTNPEILKGWGQFIYLRHRRNPHNGLYSFYLYWDSRLEHSASELTCIVSGGGRLNGNH